MFYLVTCRHAKLCIQSPSSSTSVPSSLYPSINICVTHFLIIYIPYQIFFNHVPTSLWYECFNRLNGLLIRQWEAVWRWEVGLSGSHPNGEICSAQPGSGPSTLSPIIKELTLHSWGNFAKILFILRNIRVKIMSDGCSNSGREIRLWC